MDTIEHRYHIDNYGFNYAPPLDRSALGNFRGFASTVSEQELQDVVAKACKNCGVPTCHVPVIAHRTGCPVENIIPEFIAEVRMNGLTKKAYGILDSTNNFPEFTGQVCPAPCEYGCTHSKDVKIKLTEFSIIEKAFESQWVQAIVPALYTGKNVAVVGSGPAGLAYAQEMVRKGHSVTVFEKSKHPGGLLYYGIPNFKMEKWYVERRIMQLRAEGVKFVTGTEVGTNAYPAEKLLQNFDQVALAGGAQTPRDLTALTPDVGRVLDVPGRNLKNIHFVMEFVGQKNWEPGTQKINAKGKHVVVIGGGDSGSDAIGTSHRQGAASITQLEILPQPPEQRTNGWPYWPNNFTTSSSQEEAQARGILTRLYATNAQAFKGEGRVESMEYTDVKWVMTDKGPSPVAMDGAEHLHSRPADLVIIAAGFTGARKQGLLTDLKVPFDPRGNVLAYDYQVPHESNKIVVAGDIGRGQSLVVWAIAEGREAARAGDSLLVLEGSELYAARDNYPNGRLEKYLDAHPEARAPAHVIAEAAKYAAQAQALTLSMR